MSEHQSAARKALLADAVAQRGDGAVPAKVGDCDSYLHCYYRHVDSSDLIAAGPSRVGAVAAAHAQLAALRPQGRAVVRVRPGADATLLPDRDVIDVVTDDMPFLVDTLTMTLASHDVSPELVVHPQLVVRRDVTGALREVISQNENRSADRPGQT
ncbi:MAG: NAD-glutamate dehydrogenase, partial [Nocardiopsaceae bacterium]|nr:NAD-glutamate dehydrogenase [Nocardiopsaceae bacterium]